MTVRGGSPAVSHGLNADSEDGPAARSFAADVYDCITVPILTDRPHTSAPRDLRDRLIANSPWT
jgi:hypothetical protein